MDPTDRIVRERERLLAREDLHREETELLWVRAWMRHSAEPWHLVRRAQATAEVLQHLTLELGEDDLLAGRFASRPLAQSERDELAGLREHLRAASPDYGQRAHMSIDYPTLLRLGLNGLRRQIDLYRSRLDVTRPEDQERDAFYRACLIALEGVSTLAARYAARAQALAERADAPARRADLSTLAAILRRVPDEPPATFHEALQAAHLVTFCLTADRRMGLFQLGRPDRYLLPFYRRDLAAGRLTPERAQELVDAFCLLFSANTARGLAVGFMVGGRDGSGADVTNELTCHFLESIPHTRLAYPGIGLCWNDDTPPDVKRRACELLADGLTHPALFNDDVISAGMVAAGLPAGEACLYQHSTCVEITPIGSSNVYVASPYIHLLQLLHDLLGVPPLEGGTAGQGPTGGGALGTLVASEPAAYPTFEALFTAYEAHLAQAIRQAVVDENACQASRFYHGGYPLLSCFVNDCLARGRDIDQGGARHNWVEPSFVGLANVADALAAIQRFVFQEERLTLRELAAALREGFAGREDLRVMLLQGAPKYGNDDDAVDALAEQLTQAIERLCRPYRTYLGGAYHPGFFCWVMHARLGRITAASADGRRAGEALGDGSGPAQGRERRGPTAAVLSTTKWDHTPMLGGIALNIRFSRSGQRETFLQALQDLVETYMRRGGFEIQVNVVDGDTLRAARQHPGAYRDLVVRVGGYSDYYVGLSPDMQEEIIRRTEHAPA